jgi:hypothetical protein
MRSSRLGQIGLLTKDPRHIPRLVSVDLSITLLEVELPNLNDQECLDVPYDLGLARAVAHPLARRPTTLPFAATARVRVQLATSGRNSFGRGQYLGLWWMLIWLI